MKDTLEQSIIKKRSSNFSALSALINPLWKLSFCQHLWYFSYPYRGHQDCSGNQCGIREVSELQQLAEHNNSKSILT